MAHKPQITLSFGTHHKIPVVLMDFSYNEILKSRLKKCYPDARWSYSKKTWIMPKEKFELQFFFHNFIDLAFIDYSQILPKKEVEIDEPIKTTKPDEPDSEVPKYYIDLLRQKRYSPSTIKTYVHYFRKFLSYFKNDNIDNLPKERINSYLLELIEKENISISQQNQRINAIKFYYEKVLGLDPEYFHLERPRKERKLPDVLSKNEIGELLSSVENIKHKSMLALIYSCGLRRSEAINLKLQDIDSERLVIKIRGAKGKKDRYVQLSEKLLGLLQDYQQDYHPRVWVFEGQKGGQYGAESISRFLKSAALKAGITKRVYPHILRHSYATHQLEQGVDIRFIQQWLGHESLKTTQKYTHVSEQNFRNFRNPLDDLL